jgi:queuine tRNA-ribosyltransferase
MAFRFEIIKKDSLYKARLGRLETDHGSFTTPAFLPVGTQGTVKSLTPEELVEIGVEAILGNTYHLYLRPGHETIGRLGGLHTFIHWERPILTDSGGFQIFSLGSLRKISEEGDFQLMDTPPTSHSRKGDETIGPVLILPYFNECVPSLSEYVKNSMERTSQKRCLQGETDPLHAVQEVSIET